MSILTAHFRRPALLRLTAVGVAGVPVGAGVALGGSARVIAILATSFLFVGVISFKPAAARISRHGFLAVEGPILLLVLATLSFRVRSAEALQDNPADSASAFRLACVGLAVLLASLSLISRRSGEPARHTTVAHLSLRLFALYVGVVFVAAPFSVSPLLTAYRGIELAAATLVVVAGLWRLGEDASRRGLNTLMGSLFALLLTVWAGVLISPGRAIRPISSPIPFQIQGIFPPISSNTVGTIGAIIALTAVAGWMFDGQSLRLPGLKWVAGIVGVVTTIASQYRTGYVAFVASLIVLLILNRRIIVAFVLTISSLAILAITSSSVATLEPFLLRGQSRAQAMTFSGRLGFWEAAISVWQTSPLIGRGLVTATRFEVLEPLGLGHISTIHGTWIEALVGTGILGAFLLATAYLSLLVYSVSPRIIASHGGLPAAILVFLGIRSVTGTSFEIFGLLNLLFLILASLLCNRSRSEVLPSHISDQSSPPLPVNSSTIHP
jgi:hypothetical protein